MKDDKDAVLPKEYRKNDLERAKKELSKNPGNLVEDLERHKEKLMKSPGENNIGVTRLKEEKRPNHPEAFKILTYECITCGFQENIWNSRDGAPIFFVDCQKCGREAQRIRRDEDILAIDYRPKRGERIIQDISPGRARAIATIRVDMFKGTPDEIVGPDRLAIIERITEELVRNRIPDLVVIVDG